jgi:thiamine pyrophosphokinase
MAVSMLEEIKIYDSPVILLGGGDINWFVLQQYLDTGYPVVAADGAANDLKDTGIVPDLIIGDLDSLEDQDFWASQTQVHKVSEQDTTDFEKCLLATRAPSYLGFGFLGKRFDHSLAALHVLAKYCDHKPVLLVDMADAVLVTRKAITLTLPPGSRVSLFPLGPVEFETSSGLEYPLDDLVLEIGTRSGTSNKSIDETVHLKPRPENNSAFAIVVDAEFHSSLPV